LNLKYTFEQIVNEIGNESSSDQRIISSVSYDSRTIVNGTGVLFFALNGKFRNGLQFVKQAYEKGVRHFVVSESVKNELSDIGEIVVENPLVGLQKLAGFHRAQFNFPVIAITGSNGKTIVKEWLSTILSAKYNVVKSPKSYNSQLGVPISLLQLSESNSIAVIEVGISKPGEMKVLQEIVSPTHGILTNIGSAHLENFASRDELLKEKIILFEGLNEVVSSMDLPGQPFSTESESGIEELIPFDLRKSKISSENALMAIAMAKKLGLSDQQIAASAFEDVAMRMEIFDGIDGSVIINDSYSLDKEALQISLEYQLKNDSGKRRVVILGLTEKDELRETGLKSIISEFSPIEVYFHYPESKITYNLKGALVLIKGDRKAKMEHVANALKRKKHATYIEIDLNRIRDNIALYNSKLEDSTKVLCMVKASAYGADATKLGEHLTNVGIDYLGVAYADEGIQLRDNKIELPILVMNCDDSAFKDCIDFKLEPAIYSLEQLEILVKELIVRDIQNFPIHLKLETGMNRLGFAKQEIEPLMSYLKAQPEVYVKSVYSHLAESDKKDSEFTRMQIGLFEDMSKTIRSSFAYEIDRHILNSEGVINYPNAQFEMIRLGIGMYGLSSNKKAEGALKPAIRWMSNVSQVKVLMEGDSVGYGRKFVADKKMKVAIIPIGYADGFRRSLGEGVGSVFIGGKEFYTVGSICMDMTIVDITNSQIKVNDRVEIIGENQSVEQLANKMETIPYEVLTGFSSRLQRLYLED
jgi:alanine racemase